MSKFFFVISIIILITSLPGCGVKTHKLVPSETPQAEKNSRRYALIPKYLRSTQLYDEFSLKASFDVLWMSQEMQHLYAQAYVNKRGGDAYMLYEKEQLLAGQTGEYVTFYVLAELFTFPQAVLSERESAWTLYLVANDGSKIKPYDITEIELAPELITFFGACYSRFKTVYRLRFSPRGDWGDMLIDANKKLTMVFDGGIYTGRVAWNGTTGVLPKKDTTSSYMKVNRETPVTQVEEYEDFYWG